MTRILHCCHWCMTALLPTMHWDVNNFSNVLLHQREAVGVVSARVLVSQARSVDGAAVVFTCEVMELVTVTTG